MRSILAVLAVLCAPVAGWAQGPQAGCVRAAEAVLTKAAAANIAALSAPAVWNDGACRISSAQIGDVNLTEIAFRWTTVAGRENVEMEITALEIAALRFTVTAAFQYMSDSGELTLDGLSARSGQGYGVATSGRMTLGGPAQASLGTVEAQLFVDAEFLADLGLDADTLSRARVTTALNGLDFGQLDRQSRQDILRFAGVIPNARGRLDLTVQAPNGLGLGQMILPFVRVSEADIPAALAAALQGAQVTLRWNPGRL